MEQWIETRLWNQKVKNEPIIIKQVSSELCSLFGLTMTPKAQRDLEAKIEKIRFRIYKRYGRWISLRSEWATRLGLPEKMIQRWFRAGWIDPQKSETVNILAGMIFERDYYYRFIAPRDADDKIPEDPGISITSV